MRAPYEETLRKAFPHLSKEEARLIRKLAKTCDDGAKLRELIAKKCPKTDAYARSCYNDPFNSHMWRVTMTLHAIDEILGTHGVCGLGEGSMREGPPFEYCNAGDPYSTTLLYHRKTDNLFIGCWETTAKSQGL